jgi:hypothetical protein
LQQVELNPSSRAFKAWWLLVILLASASSRQSVGIDFAAAMHVPEPLSKNSSWMC